MSCVFIVYKSVTEASLTDIRSSLSFFQSDAQGGAVNLFSEGMFVSCFPQTLVKPVYSVAFYPKLSR